jgi:hypothetical protein
MTWGATVGVGINVAEEGRDGADLHASYDHQYSFDISR